MNASGPMPRGLGWWWSAWGASTGATTAPARPWPSWSPAAGRGVTDLGPIADPLDLLGLWDDADLAVVIDAVRTGAEPGTVPAHRAGHRDAGDPGGPGPSGGTSTHGIGLAGVLRLARAVGSCPERVVVVGIEGDDFGQGEGLTPRSPRAVPHAARHVDRIDDGADRRGRLMCTSRLHRVVAGAGPGAVTVADVEGHLLRVSLLALDGPAPVAGEWLVVHSGYAVDRVGSRRGRVGRGRSARRRGGAGPGRRLECCVTFGPGGQGSSGRRLGGEAKVRWPDHERTTVRSVTIDPGRCVACLVCESARTVAFDPIDPACRQDHRPDR